MAVVHCLLDTNVLLRGLDRTHQHCAVVRRALIALRRQNKDLCLTAQNLIEFWAVATRPVDSNGLGMSAQWAASQLVRMKHFFTILPDSPEVLPEWERLVLRHSITGKRAHDARLAAVMNVHGVTHIVTFNGPDFSRFSELTIIDPRTAVTAAEPT